MPAILSPNAKQQFFTDGSEVAAGYRLWTYVANGAPTLATTYANRAGTVPNSNPIILDARGEATIYLAQGVVYDYVLKTDQDVTVYTREDVSADAGDANSVTFTQAGFGAIARPSQDKMRERVTPEDFGAVGSGLVDDLAAIAAADAVGPFYFVAGKTYRVGSNLTIESDVEFEPGAMLSIDSGVTVTFNGTVEAGVHRIFSGAGDAAGFPNNWTLYPEWWGALPDGATDSTTSLQKALSTAIGREVPLSGLYLTSAPLVIAQSVAIRGKSKTNSGIKSNQASGDIIEIQCGSAPLTDVQIRDITIDAASAKTSGFGISVNATSGGTLYDGVFENIYMTARMFSGFRCRSAFFMRLTNVDVIQVGQNGVGFEFRGVDSTSKVANVFVTSCQVRSGVAGTNTYGMVIDSYAEGLYVRDCTLESPGLTTGVIINNSMAAPRPPENLWFNTVICDSANSHGWSILAAKTVRMTDCWSVSCSGDGVRMDAVTDIELKGHTSIGNGNYGVFATTTLMKQLRILGGVFDANGQAASNTYSGIAIASNVSDFTIKDADFYRFGTTKTHKYDIEISGGTSNNYIIKNNRCMGYLTAGVQDGGSGVNKVVNENLT